MKINLILNNRIRLIIQLIVFFAVNSLFVLKYTARTSFNPIVVLFVYVVSILAAYLIFQRWISSKNERVFKVLFLILLISMSISIAFVLVKIDPYSIRVDRWSALSFFWDSFFQGKYPYATHTHVSTINFPSPFPFWHLISLPFYLLGDVGIGIIFFLIVTSFVVKYFFQSFKAAFVFLSLLALSPGYWWEVFARSDSLSNAFFVFMILLWAIKNNKSLNNSFIWAIFISGAIATTRFTAILPVALFVFPAFLKLPWKRKIIYLSGAFLVAFLIFSPFIFWDTEQWIFFKRNPFMSQTKNGSLPVFLSMMVLGVLLSLSWKNKFQYFFVTSVFIFVFILSTQIVIFIQGGEGTFFEGSIVDISYFNLALPYCLINFSDFLSNTRNSKINAD